VGQSAAAGPSARFTPGASLCSHGAEAGCALNLATPSRLLLVWPESRTCSRTLFSGLRKIHRPGLDEQFRAEKGISRDTMTVEALNEITRRYGTVYKTFR
jgi:hypothetical protein